MTEEENLKIKFLDLEKRFVELEMSVSKLKDQLKGLEGIKMDELLERIEELEDLILVESAAANELRNLIESNDTTEIKGEVENLRKSLEEKVGNLEKSFSEISENVKEKLKSLEELKVKVENEINKRLPESLLTDFVKLQNEISFLKINSSSISKELEKLSSDIQILKPDVIKEVLSKVVEIKEELENKLQNMNLFISQNIEKFKEISTIQSKVNELTNQVSEIRASLEIVKSQLSLLSSSLAEIKNKEQIISNYVRIEDFSNLVIDFKRISQELEKIKKDELTFLTKDEMKRMKEEIESLKKSIEELKSITVPKNVIQSIANKIEFLEAKIKELENLSKEKIKPIILE